MIRDENLGPKRMEADLFDHPASVAPYFAPTKRRATRSGDIPFMQRPTCTIQEACKAAGMGRTKFYELIKGGELKTVSIGRRRLVQVPSLLKSLRIESDEPTLGRDAD